jgi:XTP/dITP diphosphohydrolase
MGGRIVLLVTSPRLPAGLLTARAWEVLRGGWVCAAEPAGDSPLVVAVRAAGVPVTAVEPSAGVLLDQLAAHGCVVWLAGPTGDRELAGELGARLVREPGLAELELVIGSWDPQGARLLDAVAVLDRLVAPGGDPWLSRYAQPEVGRDGLARYLLEEAYEAYDALRAGDLGAFREELGDVLLQVVLHARIGALAETDPFTIDDVAGDLVAKMIRRNPHVFGGAEVADLDEITRNWERIKREEKSRTSILDGIALSQPALTLAAEILDRTAPAGAQPQSVPVPVPESAPLPESEPASESSPDRAAISPQELAAGLFALVARGRAAGLDAEAELRRLVLDTIDRGRGAAGESS